MNTIEIKDISDPKLHVFSGMSERELYHINEPEPGVFIAESANVVLRALEAGYEPLSLLIEKERMETEGSPVFAAIRETWGDNKADTIPVYTAGREIVTRLTGYKLVRGLWAVFSRKRTPDLDHFLEGKDRITLLYDVVNPTNVGAIIRSAAALGMDGAVLSHASVDPLTRRSARVSMGTVFQLPWTRITDENFNGTEVIKKLRELGYITVAMALTEDSVDVCDEEMLSNEKLAVIMGTEGDGLPKDVISKCDYRVMIPMDHGVDSLNVAAASAIIFWNLRHFSQK